MKYRIVYGETMPAWSREITTMKELQKFVARCMSVGDLIFGIEELREGYQPRIRCVTDMVQS